MWRQLKVERERESERYRERYRGCSSIYADSYNNCPSSSASSCHICKKHALNFRKHKQFPLNISFSTNHLATPQGLPGIFNSACCSSSITILFLRILHRLNWWQRSPIVLWEIARVLKTFYLNHPHRWLMNAFKRGFYFYRHSGKTNRLC